jgi:hypothetical protein
MRQNNVKLFADCNLTNPTPDGKGKVIWHFSSYGSMLGRLKEKAFQAYPAFVSAFAIAIP